MKKIIAAGTLLMTVIIVILYIYSKGHIRQNTKATTETEARTQTIRYVAAEGRIETLPDYEVEVGSEIEGRIAESFVEEGDRVKKGGLIARIEDRDLKAKLKEAEAEARAAWAKYREVASGAREEELRRADATYDKAVADAENAATEADRYKRLFDRGIVSRSAFDETERVSKVASARATEALEERNLLRKGPKEDTVKYYKDASDRYEATVLYCKTLLDKARITAPISGRVIRKYLRKGEMVSKDVTPLLVAIADTERLRVNAEVDETDVGRFSLGDPVEVTSYAFPGTTFKGKVDEISDYAGLRKVLPNNPAKNRDMKIVQVKISLPEKTPFKLGMTVDVKIIPKKRP